MRVAMPKLTNQSRKSAVVPAVHANPGVEHWYRTQLDGIVQQAHSELTTIAVEALAVRAQYASDAEPSLRQTTHLQKTLKRWADKWGTRFDKMSDDLAKRFATKNFDTSQVAMRTAFKRAGFTVAFKPTRASLNAYKAVVAENVNLIKSIPSQYLTNVQSAVWASVNRGGDMGALSKQLTREYGSTLKRAAIIARDQNNKAKAVIESTRRLELGITRAVWQHSSGGKIPRPTHVAMDGKVFDLKKGMYDSAEQANVLPGQLINCRCTSRAIIPGFNDLDGETL